jgi:hypothetical protein
MPVHSPGEACGRQMHALLSPHHEGADNCVLRELPNRRAAACGLEKSEGSNPRIFEDAQRAGVEAADGDRGKGVLQRVGWISAVEIQLLAQRTASSLKLLLQMEAEGE